MKVLEILETIYWAIPTLWRMVKIPSSLVIHLQAIGTDITPSYSLIHQVLTWFDASD